MSKDKQKSWFSLFLPELGLSLLAVAGIWLVKYTGVVKQEFDRILCTMVLVVLGISVVGFRLRLDVLHREMEYDNAEHIKRFWLCFLSGLAVAFACVFLPTGAWSFLAVFVLLGLFGSQSIGIFAGAVLLAIPSMLTGSGIEVYLLYFISGMFGVVLFGRLGSGFRVGRSIFLSLGCLFVCLTAGTVLVENVRPDAEYFLVPAVNVVVSGLLLFGILKVFSSKIFYRYREDYLDLNDTENEILSKVRGQDKSRYMRIVHTTYFCERIAIKLGLDQEALKCAGYYHDLEEQVAPLLEEGKFPPKAKEILEEYGNRDKPIRRKETAVLTACVDVIREILERLEQKGAGTVDYDGVIDSIFAGYRENGQFNQCDITMRELFAMQKIFKEEKLYYDFLR